jgi:prefoldin subunit 5
MEGLERQQVEGLNGRMEGLERQVEGLNQRLNTIIAEIKSYKRLSAIVGSFLFL